MKIDELIRDIRVKNIYGTTEGDVKGIAYDSRLIKEGYLFVAIKGEHTDGHRYITDAIKKGASVIIGEDVSYFRNAATFIEVADSREAIAIASRNFYGNPSGRISLIGITGTNGKTTTSFLIKNILETWGKAVGLLGTIHYIIGQKSFDAPHTTPESLDLQAYLNDMVTEGAGYAVLEVSSHALYLKRVEGCRFEVAVFTNLTRDHLDFHGTMERYFGAKKLLFNRYLKDNGVSVINVDDPSGRILSEGIRGNVISYGLSSKDAMVTATDIEKSMDGLRFKVKTDMNEFMITSSLVGMFNVYNILCSVSAAIALGVDSETIKKGVVDFNPPPGRFERITLGQDFMVVIDYAHSEDALERLITTARELTKNRVITLFGCGGDRDRGKRPRMGHTATDISDFVIITSDNPRGENSLSIIKEIQEGITKENYYIIPDRTEAIRKAIEIANTGDIVLIAGKGHEEYQEIDGVRYPFKDRSVVEDAIKERLGV